MNEPTKEDYEQAVLVHRVEPFKSNNKGGNMIKRVIINYIDKPSETVEIKRIDKKVFIEEVMEKYNEMWRAIYGE